MRYNSYLAQIVVQLESTGFKYTQIHTRKFTRMYSISDSGTIQCKHFSSQQPHDDQPKRNEIQICEYRTRARTNTQIHEHTATHTNVIDIKWSLSNVSCCCFSLSSPVNRMHISVQLAIDMNGKSVKIGLGLKNCTNTHGIVCARIYIFVIFKGIGLNKFSNNLSSQSHEFRVATDDMALLLFISADYLSRSIWQDVAQFFRSVSLGRDSRIM